jgi:hypothetical protein
MNLFSGLVVLNFVVAVCAAQPVVSSNILSSGFLVSTGGHIGGSDLSFEWVRNSKRSSRLGIEWQTSHLGATQFTDNQGLPLYIERLSSDRIGFTHHWRFFLMSQKTDMPAGLFWGPSVHAGFGFTNAWPDNKSRWVGQTGHYNMRVGAGLTAGYAARLGRFTLEPALRIGYLTYPAAPKNFYNDILFGRLDLLASRFLYSRFELNLGYRF